MKNKIESVPDAILRVALRMIPLLPAPELFDVIVAARRSQSDVDKQVQEAVDALSRSSILIDNLGETLKARGEKLTLLQQEYNRISQLASLTAEQGEAVALSLEKALGRSQNKERIIAFAINIIAGLLIFVFGIFAHDLYKIVTSWFKL